MVDELVAEGTVIAEKGADFERAVGEVVGTRNRPVPGQAEHADEDTLVKREDLGPDAHTFVAAGDPIPPGLAELPRRPARGAPRGKK
jgi:hypothetical protein